MSKKISIFFQYFIGVLGAIIITPFVIAYYLVIAFWKMFGMSILGFLVLGLFGWSFDEAMKYGASMGFFIGLFWKLREINNKD